MTVDQHPYAAPELALASAPARTARWFRHAPAERAPLAGIPAVWTAAEILHATGASAWFTGAAALAAAGVAFGVGERRIRAEAEAEAATPGTGRARLRGAELAAAVGGVGAWTAAAAKWGPLAGPFDLLTLVYGTGAVCGYWWLRTHDAVRDARARREAAAAAAADARAKRADWHWLAGRVGLRGSHLLAFEPNRNGEVWEIDTYSARQLASRVDCKQLAEKLAGERGVPRGRVEVSPDPELVYRLRVFWRSADPWKGGSADAYVWHPWASGELDPGAPFAELAPVAPSILDPISLGADPETGAPLALPLFGDKGAERILLIATSGSGKSMLLDTIRAGVTACPDARLLAINLSKGVEDAWWEPLTEASALASDENPDGRALAILDFLTAAYKARPHNPARKAGARWHRPTPAEPAFVLIIDEYDEVSRDPERKAAVETLLSKCRSEGIPVILAAQRPVGKWVSPSIKANISRIVWSKLRANDARHLAGNEGFELPDMGAYGGGNAGIFGVCGHPTYPGMPYLRGRAFFWGDDSAGMLQLISARAGGHEPYLLEPALAPLAGLWAKATGAAPLTAGDDGRYDVATTRTGQTVPGVAGVRGKLAAIAGMLSGSESPQERPGPAATSLPPGPRSDIRATLLTLAGRPGGVSRGEAVDATPLQKTKIHEVFAELCRAGQLELRGEGRAARYYATRHLRAVPDAGPAEDVS